MPDAASSPSRPDEIYVGYLPVPPGDRRFLRWVVPATLWLLCGISFLWAWSQHNPGPAVWEDGQAKSFRGTLIASPYPILFADDAGDGRPGPLLLVESGKHGSGTRLAPWNAKRVSISGWLLRRDGRKMLELEPGDAAVAIDASSPTPVAQPILQTLSPTTLRGEIVDAKCFLGAMKPGEGKTHKDCATLCIRGGIPPMLVTRDADGRASYFLLVDPSGGPLDPAAHQYIADPVEIRGELATWGGLNVLKLRPADIRRL